ncbi:MAG: acyltransferase [Burkholderiales bacterium]|nr:acyltransferase [Burkholderiales bacterium]
MIRNKFMGFIWKIKTIFYTAMLSAHGVSLSKSVTFLGGVKIYRGQGKGIMVGQRTVFASDLAANPLNTGICIRLSLLTPSATISIGDDCGISECSITSQNEIFIGNRVLIGAGCSIFDTDFHLTASEDRRYNRSNAVIPSTPVIIDDDVWLGAKVTILKGVKIGKGSIIAAGSVVAGEIPDGVIAGGIPAKVIKLI